MTLHSQDFVPLGEEDGGSATDLYRHFDAAGNLLYVGISLNTVARLSQHKRNARWYEQIVRIDIERFRSRTEALAAEDRAIEVEKPLHNIAKNRSARSALITEIESAKAENAKTLSQLSSKLSVMEEHYNANESSIISARQAIDAASKRSRFWRLLNRDALEGLKKTYSKAISDQEDLRQERKAVHTDYKAARQSANALDDRLLWLSA